MHGPIVEFPVDDKSRSTGGGKKLPAVMESETDCVVDAEDGRLVDTDDLFGDIVENKNFAVLEHNKTDIFVIVEVFLGYVDVGYWFLF